MKPAVEFFILARKPLDGTVAANVLKWGTGALNLDACRYAYGDPAWPGRDEGDSATNPAVRLARGCRTYCGGDVNPTSFSVRDEPQSMNIHPSGRFPANVYACPKASRSEREAGCEGLPARTGAEAVDREEGSEGPDSPRAGAGRTADAVRNHHPTVKALALMRWLVRLVTPPAGLCLDPFLGSGTTGCAAIMEGFRFLGIEKETDYARIAEARMAWADREWEIATTQAELFAAPNSRTERPTAEPRRQTTLDFGDTERP